MERKVFIAIKVDDAKMQKLGEELVSLLAGWGFSSYLPKKKEFGCVDILESNEREVDAAEIILAVFDGAGAGVGMELERAYSQGKEIVGMRASESINDEYLGKMLEGFWERLPVGRKARATSGLEEIFTNL